jgi:hypothetical protein
MSKVHAHMLRKIKATPMTAQIKYTSTSCIVFFFPILVLLTLCGQGKICSGNHILGGNIETNSKNIFRLLKKIVTWHIHYACIDRCTLSHFCKKMYIYGCTVDVPNCNFSLSDRNTVFYLVSIFHLRCGFHCIFSCAHKCKC